MTVMSFPSFEGRSPFFSRIQWTKKRGAAPWGALPIRQTGTGEHFTPWRQTRCCPTMTSFTRVTMTTFKRKISFLARCSDGCGTFRFCAWARGRLALARQAAFAQGHPAVGRDDPDFWRSHAAWALHPMAACVQGHLVGGVMKTIFDATRAVSLAAAVFIVAACTPVQEQAGAKESVGLACNKCRTTWVSSGGGKPGGSTIYRTSRQMKCPQCETLVETFFRTGQLAHSCPGCGGTVSRCTVQFVR